MSAFRRLRISIAPLLTFGVVGLVLAAVSVALLLGFSSAAENTRALLADKARGFVNLVALRIERQLGPVQAQSEWIARAIAEGRADPDSGALFDDLLAAAMAATPQVKGMGFLRPDMRMRRVSRDLGIRDDEDESNSPWARGFLETLRRDSSYPESSWMAPFWVPELQQTVVAHETVVRRDGELAGVLYQVVAVSDIARTLAELAEGSGFTPFILYADDWILGHPLLIDWKAPRGNPAIKDLSYDPDLPFYKDSAPLPPLGEIDDPVLARIHDGDARPIPILRGVEGFSGKVVRVGGDAHHVIIHRTLHGYGARPWTVGIHAADDVVGTEIRRLGHHAGAGLLILVLAVLAAWLVSHALARPVQRLAEAANRVRADDLDGAARLESSFIREYDAAAAAFNAMVAAMRERRTIREVFGRYIPTEVAASLLRGRGELEPVTARATVLFVDLEGFTALSQALRPEEIVELLNAFFSEVVAIVEREGGVITQFQGDAALAVFNVPIPAPDHARRALRAAAAILARVAERPFAGRRLACRIGINTGEVVAGGVGARGRQSYTVHGDAVNVAARLERLNKDHGTRLLAAQATVAEAADMPMRRVGAATPRGRTDPVTLYTLDLRPPEGETRP